MVKIDTKKKVRFVSLMLAIFVVLSGLAIALVPVEAAETAGTTGTTVLSGGDIVRVSAKFNDTQIKCSCYQVNIEFKTEYFSITEKDIVNKISPKDNPSVTRHINNDNGSAVCNMFCTNDLSCPADGVFCVFNFTIKDGKKINYSDVATLLKVYKIEFYEDPFGPNLGKNLVTIEYSYKRNSSSGDNEISSVMIGDVDGNGKINTMDVALLKQYRKYSSDDFSLPEALEKFNIGQKTSCFYAGIEIVIGDINGNGKIDGMDPVILKQYQYYKSAEITIPSETEKLHIGELAYSV